MAEALINIGATLTLYVTTPILIIFGVVWYVNKNN